MSCKTKKITIKINDLSVLFTIFVLCIFPLFFIISFMYFYFNKLNKSCNAFELAGVYAPHENESQKNAHEGCIAPRGSLGSNNKRSKLIRSKALPRCAISSSYRDELHRCIFFTALECASNTTVVIISFNQLIARKIRLTTHTLTHTLFLAVCFETGTV